MQQGISDKAAIDRLADKNGIAVALVDQASTEIYVANNNSICRSLNPAGKFNTHCKAFCGTAFEEASEVGATVSFTCHAGLECRVVPVDDEGVPLVAIIGRTFIKAENYRRATTRAISGDWKDHSPAEFFENVLLAGSASVLDKAAAEIEVLMPRTLRVEAVEPELAETPEPSHTRPENTVQPIIEAKNIEPPRPKPVSAQSNIVARFNRELGLVPTPQKAVQQSVEKKSVDDEPFLEIRQATESQTEPAPVNSEPEIEAIVEEKPRSNEKRAAEARAWRSFFGSLLKVDYPKAADSILEFIAIQYGLSATVWLEKNDKRLENAAAYGEMKNRKVRLGIASDDHRLIEAAQKEMPLEINEKPKEGAEAKPRTMYLFPIGLGGEISAAIAILENIEEEKVKRHIARICQSIAPQLEILRLRSQVARGESLSTAVRRFSESLKNIDADDLWLKLTQNAAEMLGAERASLMILDERSQSLQLMALIGGLGRPGKDEVVGARVARLVFDKNKPIIVPDVAKTGLPPAGASRNYKTASFISCPLSISGRTIGVMSFADRVTGKPFDRGSLNLFNAIAPQLAVAIDRASLKEKAGEFEQLSVTDALTGLLNRRYIEARLMEEVKRSNRHGFPMSFMMIDVDHFKSYNDQFGHPAGDEALKLVGHVIRETLRGADVAARYGGEEFSILLPQTTGEEAGAIAERIRSNIAETRFPHRRVTISIGIASCSADLCSAIDLVKAADKALYEAKKRGRNRVLPFEKLDF
ncbi:MAG TPA: diguanylate cyclase [Pyrinomonadaceae bacterium]|nr:diguanylate cyclase [Acidobacteriota bacterium]HQZ95383.1 diguanylate cyclase [Pyrinomonadaceae bacterium]